MKNFFNREEMKNIDKLNEISGLHHRSSPYDLNNSNDLKEMLKIKVCALLDYNEYDEILDDLIERFDESIEYYDTSTWLSFTMDIEKPDALLLKCYEDISEACDNFNKLVKRTSEEFIDALRLVLNSTQETRIAVLGFDFCNVAEVENKLDEVLDIIYDVANSNNMEEAYNNFLIHLRELFLDD